tara:strand:+ start:2701 stop:4377 length:1677 start_codon:yes stop_codon:yes gene_type:complete
MQNLLYLPDRLFTNSDSRDFDALAIKHFVKNSNELMQQAGKDSFEKIKELWPYTEKLLIFVGTGNNGGDGYVIANIACQNNIPVDVIQIGNIKQITKTANNAYNELIKSNINNKNLNIINISSNKIKEILEQVYKNNINVCNLVIVDALLGTGIKDKPKSDFLDAVVFINNLKQHNKKSRVLAIDVPSGLNSDTGYVHDGIAVKADALICFIVLKQGLFTGYAKEYCKDIYFSDLGVGDKLDEFNKKSKENITTKAHLISDINLDKYVKLKRREQYKSKHDFGHVVILGGDYGMGGAALMAGLAALRTGAGLVTIATHPSNAELIFLKQPELMTFGIDFNLFSENYSDNDYNFESEDRLASLLDRADVLVLGPGLGQSAWGKRVWGSIKNYHARPIVLDADGLNWLAKDQEKRDIIRDNWVLTPHPGEAGRLLGLNSDIIQQDRFKAIEQILAEYHGVCVLKGSGSIISKYEQHNKNNLKYVCPLGNPGMATAGMGDILSGVIGSLIAQGLDLKEAAQLAVVIHSKAADNIKDEYGEKGILATDLLFEIKKLVNLYSE